MVTEHARNIVALLWRPSGPKSLVMLPARMADRMMLPDKVTEMENNIGYHTSINQSEESISIRCITIYMALNQSIASEPQGQGIH